MPWKPNKKGPQMRVVNRAHMLMCDCGGACDMATGQAIYPHRKDLWKKMIYLCPDCGSYVGAHPNGTPFGTPADDRTRKARMAAHKVFDRLWQNGGMSRTEAYKKLKQETGVHHISWEDYKGCEVVITWVQSLQ